MKKMFPDEKGTKKGIREFLDKRGFYIVLLLCIAVVAGTAVYVTTRNATSDEPNYEAENLIPEDNGENNAINETGTGQLNAQQPEDTQASAAAGQQSDIGKPASGNDTDDSSALKPIEGTDKSTTPNVTAKPETSPAPKTTTPKSNTSRPKQQSFVMPVNGDFTQEYAKDELVYSKTLEEWRAHAGVDIASDRGTPVKAVADGVVIDVDNDSYLGITVVIDHGNDLKTVYRNLASDEAVVFNQKVKQGEVIGSIGNTAKDESSEQAHLHFEVQKKDASVDPMSYLPKSSASAD